MSDLTQLKQEEKTVFQNKMIQVVYQLFNALRFKTKGFTPLFSQKESEQTKEQMQITFNILSQSFLSQSF